MMKQKRIVSLLTAAGVLLANVPLMPAIMPATVLTASADVDEAYLDAFNNGGYGFTRDFDEATGTLTITGEGEMFDEYQLAATPFYDISGLKKLVISDGITNISDFAFSQCKTLTEVTLPESITSIGTCGFGFCSALTEIELPDSVTSISNLAFDNCTALTRITIPDGVTSIGEYTFRGCTALNEITIPDSVTEIAENAFDGCEDVTIKCSAGSYAQGYARENNISYEASGADDPVTGTCGENVTWKLKDGVLTISGTGAMADYNPGQSPFYERQDIKKVVIADSVTTVGEYLFYGCSNLESVSIPESVTSIGSCAFMGTALTSVVLPSGLTELGNAAFRICKSLTTINLPDGLTDFGLTTFAGSGLTSIVIPDGVTRIGYGAFYGCTSLTEITIPDSVKAIDDWAFRDCPKLLIKCNAGSYAEDFAKIKYIPYEAISAETLQTGTCGENLIWALNSESTLRIWGQGEMPDYTAENPSPFKGMEYDSLVIENGVENVGSNAFSGSGMKSVTLPKGLTAIGENAFSGCEKLATATIPADVESIADGAFSGCTKMTIKGYAGTYAETFAKENSIPFEALDYEMITGTCGDSLTWEFDPVFGILTVSGEGAMPNWDLTFGRPMPWYQYCPEIRKAVIADGVTSIGSYAFAQCKKMTDITVPESVTSIGYFPFSGTAWLKARQAENPLVIVNGILVDGTACEGEIVIPEGTKSIAIYAFFDCEALTGVTVPDSVKSIGGYAFCGCKGLTHINIPDGVTSIEEGLFSGCSALTGITLPASVANIGDNTFWNCKAMAEFTVLNPNCVFPESNQSFGYSDPETWEEVFDGVFRGYEGSTAQAYAEEHGYTFESLGNTPDPPADLVYQGLKYTVEDGEVMITGYTDDLPAVLEIPAEIDGKPVTAIDHYALQGNSGLTGISIPDGVSSIGTAAFYECVALTDVTIAESVESISGAAFYGTPWLAAQQEEDPLVIVNEIVIDYAKCTGDIVIPNGIFMISGGAYTKDQIPAITSVTIPRSVYQFDEGSPASRPTFGGIEGLVIKGYAESAAEAFAINHNITFEAIEEPVLVYQGLKYMIENDEVIITGYTDDLPAVLEIPAEIDGKPVTGFAQSALAQCDKLIEVTLPETITATGMQTFWNDKNLEKVTLPSGLKGIYEASFAQCTSLKSITIPDGCETIGNLIFAGCTALEEINIPASVINFYEPAFGGTPWLAAQQAENPLVAVNGILIDASAAFGEVTVPDGVTVINAYAFMDCDAITKMTLPASVTQIDGIGCAALTDVTILNPDCVIKDDEGTITNGYDSDAGKATYKGTIHGYANSTAETYAKTYGYKFESLEPAALKGDVDGNGAIELDDAQLALAAYTNQLAHKPSGLTAAQEQTADVSGDGEVTVDDAQAILQYYTETLAHKNPTWDKILNPNQA